ncbi:MAG TPA: hypothetical protein VL485_16835 [Ktedonobacteraceae bacterium]|jgi:hypothetical protein|nr:hypothetical protein [Ktedonobacteraceae bacterium]
MNRTTIFMSATNIAVLALLLAIYYAMREADHMLDHGFHLPLSPQPTHLLLFVLIAALGALIALNNRPGATHR